MVSTQLRSTVLLLGLIGASAFAPPLTSTRPNNVQALKAHDNNNNKGFQNAVSAAIVASTLSLTSLAPPAVAYEASDYASETVTGVLSALKTSGSNAADTFKVFEDIAAIITEGKGVGGSINYGEYYARRMCMCWQNNEG